MLQPQLQSGDLLLKLPQYGQSSIHYFDADPVTGQHSNCQDLISVPIGGRHRHQFVFRPQAGLHVLLQLPLCQQIQQLLDSF